MTEYSSKNQFSMNKWNQLVITIINNQNMIGDCGIRPSARSEANVPHQKLSDQNL